MQTQDNINEKQLQITYYKNMEFFKGLNPKLFNALRKTPTLYNLHIDSYGLNIIYIPNKTMQYPLIKNNTKETYKTSMQDKHKELAKNPMKNPQWELFSNHVLTPNAHFINEEKLAITGKLCNDLLKNSIKIGLESKIDYNATTLNELDTEFKTHCDENLDYIKDHKKTTQQDSIQKNTITTQSNLTLYQNLIESFCDSKFLPQTNIYGLMGGMFLQELLDKGYQFYSLLIYEEHIDLFRISLYFIDYNKLFRHVGEQSCFIIIKDISLELVSAFLHTKKLTNNFLSLSLTHYTTDNVALLKDFIYKEKKSIMRGWGSFEDELVGLKNACSNLKNSKLLSMSPKRVNAPICVIGNGASLDLCIDFLRTYKDFMILLSCGTALKVLRHHNIIPDFQIEIERVPYLSQVLKEANLGDIPLIFAQTTDIKACSLAKERYGFLRGGSSSAYLDSTYIPLESSAPFVGNAGVSIASLLGSDVILCGIDCGYIKGYSKHAKHSFYGDENTVIPKDCFQVDSNKNLQVFSNDLFYLSAKNIEQAIKLYNPNSVINLGYGMRFKHTISLNEDDFILKPINKDKEIRYFKENFISYNLILNTKEMLYSLTTFSNSLQELLTQDTHTIQDIFNLTQDVFNLLQKSIDNKIMRKSIILLEGSIMHLSYTHLLTQLFAKTTSNIESKTLDSKHYAKNTHLIELKTLYSKGLFSLISNCKKSIMQFS